MKEQEQDKDTLDMSFFDENSDIELNFGDSFIPDEENDSEQEEDNQDENIENNTGEDQEDSEEVASDEDQQEEGGEEFDEEESDDVSPDNNLYSSFASVLSEQGLLPSLDLQKKKIESIDDLTESLKEEIDNQSKQYIISKLGEDGYNALEKGISLSEYQSHQDSIQTLDSITDDVIENDLELAKKIIQQDYISQGMDEKRVMRILKKSIDLGDETVIEDAKESLESLKVIEARRLEQLAEQRQQQQLQQKQYQEKIDNDLKNAIYNKDEIINGMKLNKTVKDRVYNAITKIVATNENGIAENKLMRDRRENPIEFDTKLYYLYEITNGFKDFSKIVSKSESKATATLEEHLRKNKFTGSERPAYMEDPESYGGLGTELVL